MKSSKNRSVEEYYNLYFGIILQGTLEEFQRLKEHIVNNTGLKIKYVKNSRFYLLIQPAPSLFSSKEEVKQ